MPETEPCARCHSETVVQSYRAGNEHPFYVCCPTCNRHGPSNLNRDDAITYWNSDQLRLSQSLDEVGETPPETFDAV